MRIRFPHAYKGFNQVSRASAFHSGRSGNAKVACSIPDLAFSNPGRVKPMISKLILVAS